MREQHTIACGNIGKPLSEVALKDRDLDADGGSELLPLEAIRTFRPSISVWLNSYHLDCYCSVAEYRPEAAHL